MPDWNGQQRKKRVLVVGAGAAGSACAWSLSRHPEKFEVHVWEALPVPGGVASSATIRNGQQVINDQVQGGSFSYRHNLNILDRLGFQTTKVDMRIAFGSGDKQWTNHSPSQLTERLKPEIAKFGRMLRWINRFEPLCIFMPIVKLLKMWGFSEEFRNSMVFPLVALFFGTGNQTPLVSSAIIARVFLDPDLKLFDYCPERLLNSVPEMFAFPVLQHVFCAMADQGGYHISCNRPVKRVTRGGKGVEVEDEQGVKEHFDDIVFACSAEIVLKVLQNPTWLEKTLLSQVQYYLDYCITHEDTDYMRRMYVAPDQHERIDQDNYFVRQYPEAPDKIEMSFNLSTYQEHMKQGGNPNPPPLYQTYYLDASNRHLWTDREVDESKIISKRWMRQFAHTYRHFARWVPFGRFIQGGGPGNCTYFAGSYTLFNTQEIAMMSGLAAAERLGADYPFPHDKLASSQFDMFLGVVHGVTRRNKGNEKAAKASAAEHEAAVARAKEHREQKEGSLLSAPVLPAEQTAAPSIDLAPPADKEAEIAKRPTSTAAA
mmetsp:Transcript_12949/g.35269  ORF Transcript_12949/g.35269 Transcript_12949/m.35269 type:complete len:543 (+) Transcript_12949:2318-3946(+)